MLQVARHFMSMDPKLSKIVLDPDYSMESHAKDHEVYVNVSRTRKRRAKALLGKICSVDEKHSVRKKNIGISRFFKF